MSLKVIGILMMVVGTVEICLGIYLILGGGS